MSHEFVQSDCYTKTDYEIGKQLFNIMLALKMIQSSPDGGRDDSFVEATRFIDSKAFDFNNALASMKGLNINIPRASPIDNESVEDCMYKIIGFVRLSGIRDEFVPLITEIYLQLPGILRDTRAPAKVNELSSIEDTAGWDTSTISDQYSVNSDSDGDNWRYTSLLWEKAQVRGMKPNIKETCLSNFPPIFRVTINCMGTEASGEARTKKLAKHLAAKRVCQSLGLKPS
ncbi:hypothetical protein FE257_009710 [Aspergillus nanangensis]|uniref:DRBM domain-containing protein n=1 Tax=Aspergillus nanangensis TaxID=2582783 RepID=A0AAD4CJV2_ASPNN|nr:hypothetical protein FE257_009710 [Aspergillus nanangensis]